MRASGRWKPTPTCAGASTSPTRAARRRCCARPSPRSAGRAIAPSSRPSAPRPRSTKPGSSSRSLMPGAVAVSCRGTAPPSPKPMGNCARAGSPIRRASRSHRHRGSSYGGGSMLGEQLDTAKLIARYALPIGWNGNKSPAIPQNDPHPNRRAFELSVIRSLYSYLPRDIRENPLLPIAVAGKYPFFEEYGLRWALPYLPQFLKSFFDTELKKLLHLFKSNVDKVKAYKHLFSHFFDLPAPPEVKDWQEARVFARNRVDGPNPLLLSRVTNQEQLDKAITISNEQFQQVMGTSRSLSDELRDGNLFLADYRLILRSLLPPTAHNRDSRWRDKYLPAPVALFCQRAGVDPYCDLVAVAIIVDQKDAALPNP